jgi:phosphoribosylamine--glycine ligase
LLKNNSNILVIGSGAREHALAWKLSKSSYAGQIYVAPGNGGTQQFAHNVDIQPTNIKQLVEFAQASSIEFVVVGPDDAFAAGVVDAFHAAKIKIFGPTRKAAQIESSKSFSKTMMQQAKIPTARFQVFTDYDEARAYAQQQPLPLVIKADGLALGKGVYICKTGKEVTAALQEMMVEKRFGAAGERIIIEQYLQGEEISIHALTDGKDILMFPSSQDHKPIGEGNTGPNTGGIGVIAPVPGYGWGFVQEAKARVIDPVMSAMADQGAHFDGCLYPGLMVENGDYSVLEYNARFGDPEAQAYVRLMESDLLQVLHRGVEQGFADYSIDWKPGFAVSVVIVSEGYPGSYERGNIISGLEQAAAQEGIELFHAGTIFKDGQYLTNGGRVINVTATADTVKRALERAYKAAKLISFKDMYYRRDIGAQYRG